MNLTNNILDDPLHASAARRPIDLFSDIADFFGFIWEELKPFPGRGLATARLVVAAVATTIICQTLRIPFPSIAAFLVFMVVTDTGASSLRIGLVGALATTIAVMLCVAVTICFMDAPWFRLPATFILVAGAMWLTQALVLGIAGRLIAITLVFYLSLADSIFDPESLTESTLWLWSIIAVSSGVSVLTSTLLEPKPDQLLRAQIATSLRSVQKVLASFATGNRPTASQAKALRRQSYALPQTMRQVLCRWHHMAGGPDSRTVDWEMAIAVVERLLAATSALGLLDIPLAKQEVRDLSLRLSATVEQLRLAVEEHNPEAIRSLDIPSADALRDSAGKATAIEIVSALSDCKLFVIPTSDREKASSQKKSAPSRPGLFVPDALTNPQYIHFAYKTVLSIILCDVFLNAVDWPGIRTCFITCVVTALATPGAQHQKQLLRFSGVCVGGLMGLIAVIYLVPKMDSIVGLSLLIAAGTACCAWVGAGSVRIAYAGFQMALAFYIVLLPGFETNIDLTGVRDRFVGIVVGITAMWFVFDNLWYAPSSRRALNKLVSILRVMATAPVVSSDQPVSEMKKLADPFRRQLYGSLESGRLLLDETKIELALDLDPKRVTGEELEAFGQEISLASLLLLALNESKWRALDSDISSMEISALTREDERLAQAFIDTANLFSEIDHSEEKSSAPSSEPSPELLVDSSRVGRRLGHLYRSIHDCLGRIVRFRRIMGSLP